MAKADVYISTALGLPGAFLKEEYEVGPPAGRASSFPSRRRRTRGSSLQVSNCNVFAKSRPTRGYASVGLRRGEFFGVGLVCLGLYIWRAAR